MEIIVAFFLFGQGLFITPNAQQSIVAASHDGYIIEASTEGVDQPHYVRVTNDGQIESCCIDD